MYNIEILQKQEKIISVLMKNIVSLRFVQIVVALTNTVTIKRWILNIILLVNLIF